MLSEITLSDKTNSIEECNVHFLISVFCTLNYEYIYKSTPSYGLIIKLPNAD